MLVKALPIEFTVQGKWPFPADMLRRDFANAAKQSDQDLIDLLSRDFTDEKINPRGRYTVHHRLDRRHQRHDRPPGDPRRTRPLRPQHRTLEQLQLVGRGGQPGPDGP